MNEINTYNLIDSRTKKPLTDERGEDLAFGFQGMPHNGDEITVKGKAYKIQRVWSEDGHLTVALIKTGTVPC